MVIAHTEYQGRKPLRRYDPFLAILLIFQSKLTRKAQRQLYRDELVCLRKVIYDRPLPKVGDLFAVSDTGVLKQAVVITVTSLDEALPGYGSGARKLVELNLLPEQRPVGTETFMRLKTLGWHAPNQTRQ